jgi:O-antigen/teichoic acid export membrane protein
MTGHSNVSASTYLAAVAVNVALAVALIIPFGLNGAAVASAVALTFRATWLSYAAWRKLGIRTSILAVIAAASLSGSGSRAARTPAE